MKRLLSLLAPTLFCLFLSAGPSYAQGGVRITFRVSFPFTAGTATMPAGAYTISQDENGHAIIAAENGGGSAILLTQVTGSINGRGHASVSFIERGGRYYLSTLQLTDGAVLRLIRNLR